MNIADVMDEIGTALAEIPGLRVFPYTADRINSPAAVVGLPDEPITYDTTMGRGSDRLTLPVIVAVARLDARTARTSLAAYLDGSGEKSVKAAVESGTYTSCDSVRVATAAVAVFTSAGVDYLGAEFSIEIFGMGA